MRVVFTHHISDDAGGFFGRFAGVQSQFEHTVKDAAVDGFEAVPHIGQSAGDDDRHRIVEVAVLHFIDYVVGDDSFAEFYGHRIL